MGRRYLREVTVQRVSGFNRVIEFSNDITGNATRTASPTPSSDNVENAVTVTDLASRSDAVSTSSAGEPIAMDVDAEEQLDEKVVHNSADGPKMLRLSSIDSAIVSEPPNSTTPSASDGRQDADFKMDDANDGVAAEAVPEADEDSNNKLLQPTVADNADELSDAGKETEAQALLSADEQAIRTMNLFATLAPDKALALTNFEHLGNTVGGLVERYRTLEDLMQRPDATIDSDLIRNMNGLIRQVKRLHRLTLPLEYRVNELQVRGDGETRDALFLFE